jgi:quinohemoprotein ethanol dehydrogenase
VLAEGSSDNWLVNGHDFSSQRFSTLTQISTKNISELGLAWSLDIDSPMGLAVEPIVVDGVIYIAGSLDRVYAVDAASGRLIWRVDPQVSLVAMRNSWAARTNRGVAVWEGKVFVATGDCRVIALNAATGGQLWESPVCVDTTQTGITGAPHVAAGKVFVGYNGSDSGVRGSVVAFDAGTGKVAWRFWTTPGDPAKGLNQVLEVAAKTWSGDRWWEAGGASVWDAISYDADTGLLVFGTATPAHGPNFAIKTTGDRLFSGSIVAVNAATGEYAWHFHTAQYSPGYHDPGADYPGNPDNFNIVFANLPIKGKTRHVVLTAPKTGTFFILDAKTGELISQRPLADRPQNQLSGPGPDGQARTATGRSWWPMSFNPRTGLAYIPANDHVQGRYGGLPVGRLIAWDPVKQISRWSVPLPLSINGGVLSTAGGLVFHGQATGEIAAYSADNGKKLWSYQAVSAIQSVPVTYKVGGEQYMLMPIGFGSASRLFDRGSAMGTPESKRGPARLLAFKLGAKTPFPDTNIVVPAVPKPPAQIGNSEVIRKGAIAANKFRCTNCHGAGLDGSGAWTLRGAIPDLRYMPQDVHDLFLGIVMGGLGRRNGMPGFADGGENYPLVNTTMTLDDANAIHAYIIDIQQKAYESDQARLRGQQ